MVAEVELPSISVNSIYSTFKSWISGLEEQDVSRATRAQDEKQLVQIYQIVQR